MNIAEKTVKQNEIIETWIPLSRLRMDISEAFCMKKKHCFRSISHLLPSVRKMRRQSGRISCQQRDRMKTGANGRCRFWKDAEDRLTYYEVETRSTEKCIIEKMLDEDK